MVYLYDSNFNYININRLWSTQNSLRRSCPDLNALEDFIDGSNITSLKSILIHTGVNDTDDMCGNKVGEKLFTIINKIQAKFPGIKIIVSEVTPRMDGKDTEVKKCNNVINQYAKRREGIYIAAHSNLRDQRFFRDSKHIKETKIAKFAANLKRALRIAFTTQVTSPPKQVQPALPLISRGITTNSVENPLQNVANPFSDESSIYNADNISNNQRNTLQNGTNPTTDRDESAVPSHQCSYTGTHLNNDTVNTHSATMQASDIESIFPGFQEKLISAFTRSLGMMFG